MSDKNLRANVEIRVTLQYSDRLYKIQAIALNLSDTGMFIRTREPAQQGTHVGFEFSIPTMANPIGGMALVHWVRTATDVEDSLDSYGMGIEFLDLPPPCLDAVKAYIIQMSSEDSGDDVQPVFEGHKLILDHGESAALHALFGEITENTKPRNQSPQPKTEPAPDSTETPEDEAEPAPSETREREPEPDDPKSDSDAPTAQQHTIVDLSGSRIVSAVLGEWEGKQLSEVGERLSITPRFKETAGKVAVDARGEAVSPSHLLIPSATYLECYAEDMDPKTRVRAGQGTLPEIEIGARWTPTHSLRAMFMQHLFLRLPDEAAQSGAMTLVLPPNTARTTVDDLTALCKQAGYLSVQCLTDAAALGSNPKRKAETDDLVLVIRLGTFETRASLLDAESEVLVSLCAPHLGLGSAERRAYQCSTTQLREAHNLDISHDEMQQEQLFEQIRDAFSRAEEPKRWDLKVGEILLSVEALDLERWFTPINHQLFVVCWNLVQNSGRRADQIKEVCLTSEQGVWPGLIDHLKLLSVGAELVEKDTLNSVVGGALRLVKPT